MITTSLPLQPISLCIMRLGPCSSAVGTVSSDLSKRPRQAPFLYHIAHSSGRFGFLPRIFAKNRSEIFRMISLLRNCGRGTDDDGAMVDGGGAVGKATKSLARLTAPFVRAAHALRQLGQSNEAEELLALRRATYIFHVLAHDNTPPSDGQFI